MKAPQQRRWPKGTPKRAPWPKPHNRRQHEPRRAPWPKGRTRQPISFAMPRPAPRVRRPAKPTKPVLSVAPHHRPVKVPRPVPRGAARAGAVSAAGLTAAQWQARYGNVAINTAKCTAVYAQLQAKFPGVGSNGIYNCREARDCATCPGKGFYSVHSVAGAIDVAPGSYAKETIQAYAETLSGVTMVILDPANVHVQIVPNPPAGWVPPCAGGSGGVTAPAGAILAARALLSAGCPEPQARDFVAIAARESSWVPTVHSYGRGCGPGMCGKPSHTPGAVCEDSWGLWQINWCAHEQTLKDRGINRPQLVVPAINAKAAGLISGGFSDLGPWRGLENVTETQKNQAAAAVAIVYGGAPGGSGGGGGGGTGSGAAPIRTSSLPTDCSQKKQKDEALTRCRSLFTAYARAHPGFTKDDLLAFAQQHPECTAGFGVGDIPVVGPLIKSGEAVVQFLEHVPTYLKIAGGGIIIIGGLVLIVAGATGNLSRVNQGAAGLVMRTPVGRVVERRRAIGTERATQRRRSAVDEAEARVDASGKVARRRVYRGQVAAADRANAASGEALGEDTGGRVIPSGLGGDPRPFTRGGKRRAS